MLMSNIVRKELDLSLDDNCLCNTLQISCKLLQRLAKIWKNLPGEILSVQLQIVYLTRFSLDFCSVGL